MTPKATTPDQYFAELPPERQEAMKNLRAVLKKHLPKGFEETISYGMPAYVVPHSLYPAGYHCKPEEPLQFISIASQKNYIALHHIGLYGDKALLDWFTAEWAKHSKTRLDMGKGCVRFKKVDAIPFELIGQLAERVTPAEWIRHYESVIRKR